MKKVLVVSQNPVKVDAVRAGFEKMFPEESFNFLGLAASSDVREQPLSDQETKNGAQNRVLNAKKLYNNYDYYVAIEGGVEKQESQYYDCFAWVCIEMDNKLTLSRTGSFTLPKEVGNYLDKGLELGDADDKVFKLKNSKQQNGAIGLLTNDLITRTTFYTETIALALIPFKNIHLYI